MEIPEDFYLLCVEVSPSQKRRNKLNTYFALERTIARHTTVKYGEQTCSLNSKEEEETNLSEMFILFFFPKQLFKREEKDFSQLKIIRTLSAFLL